MRRELDYYKKELNKILSKEIDYCVYGKVEVFPFTKMIFVYVVFSFFVGMMPQYVLFFLFIYIISIVVIIFFTVYKQCCVGLNDKYLSICFLNIFLTKFKKVHEVPISELKNVQISNKFLLPFMKRLKISYINEAGNFERVNVYFFTMSYSKKFREQKVNAIEIIDRLSEIQRVIEKGDF